MKVEVVHLIDGTQLSGIPRDFPAPDGVTPEQAQGALIAQAVNGLNSQAFTIETTAGIAVIPTRNILYVEVIAAP